MVLPATGQHKGRGLEAAVFRRCLPRWQGEIAARKALGRRGNPPALIARKPFWQGVGMK